jgi:tetratricopeptide (TPR) repeat protein
LISIENNNVQAAAGTNGKNSRRLVGWKAIGHFLGCTERTARRWEKRSLPVHRVPGGSRSSVWADPGELAVWLRALPSELRADLHAEAPAALAESAIAEGPAVLSDPSALAHPALAAPVEPAPPSRARSRRWLAPGASLLLVALAVSALAIRENSQRRAAPAAAAAAHVPYADNPQARETYATARFELSMRSADSLAAAEKGFRQLVELYPERAAAWSGLADTYLLLREFGSMRDEVAYPQAARAARTAVALDPQLADAWLDQAFVAFWWEQDNAVAFRDFSTALRLDPNSAKAFHWYATALGGRGNFDESLQAIRRARVLDPGNRAIAADEAWIRFGMGQRTEGLATLERLAQLDPNFVSWRAYLARAYLLLSRDQDFLREALAAAELRGQPEVVAGLQRAAQQFQTGGRQAMLEQLSADETAAWERGTGSAVTVAQYRALANDRVGMLKWLAIAEARHDHNLAAVRGFAEFSAYRTDPALREIFARLP